MSSIPISDAMNMNSLVCRLRVTGRTPSREALTQLDVSNICAGCRCGWLGCDCSLGCISCKELIHYCFCWWNFFFDIEDACLFCAWLRPSCNCALKRRCKWCIVSLAKCKRGGCLHKLPDRLSPDAQFLVKIFNAEDGPDDDANFGEAEDPDWDAEQGQQFVCPSTPVHAAKKGRGEGNPAALASISISSLVSADLEYYSGTESTSLDLDTESIGSEDGFESGDGEKCCSR